MSCIVYLPVGQIKVQSYSDSEQGEYVQDLTKSAYTVYHVLCSAIIEADFYIRNIHTRGTIKGGKARTIPRALG